MGFVNGRRKKSSRRGENCAIASTSNEANAKDDTRDRSSIAIFLIVIVDILFFRLANE